MLATILTYILVTSEGHAVEKLIDSFHEDDRGVIS